MSLPSTPYDSKGLLKTAICDNNPVISFESPADAQRTGAGGGLHDSLRQGRHQARPEAEINDRRKQRPIRIPPMLESGISAGMMVSSARAASTSSQHCKRAASVNRTGTPSSSIRREVSSLKWGRSAAPRQNCTRGRCCRRRSWPARRPARRPGCPPGSSAIGETSTRCADSPSPTSCCRRR
jgi:hypothetical protein